MGIAPAVVEELEVSPDRAPPLLRGPRGPATLGVAFWEWVAFALVSARADSCASNYLLGLRNFSEAYLNTVGSTHVHSH